MADIEPTIIEFRLEGTLELLWRSVEPCPLEGETVYYGVGSGVLTEYEVVSVYTTYRHLCVDSPPPGGEVAVPGALSNCVPTVIVKVP